jgi:hypothetical protein
MISECTQHSLFLLQTRHGPAETHQQLAQVPGSCISWQATSTGGQQGQQLQINAIDGLVTV